MAKRHAASRSLKALGVSAKNNRDLYKFNNPDPKLLERFKAPDTGSEGTMSIEIEIPEFTSLCPITGQPDSATITISYIPGKWCVESKSLKLYLMGYRNHGAFHEECVNQIAQDLNKLLSPRTLSVHGNFFPRGGISFNPTVNITNLD